MNRLRPYTTLHTSMDAYRRAHPNTIFLLTDGRPARDKTIRAIARLHDRHTIITSAKSRYPDCRTTALDDLAIAKATCHESTFVAVDGVTDSSSVSFVESLHGLILVAFTHKVRDVQLAWSAFGGTRRTYVVSSGHNVERRFYTIAEVAKMLGFSEQKTYKDASSGVFPAVKIRGAVVVPIEPFENWMIGLCQKSKSRC